MNLWTADQIDSKLGSYAETKRVLLLREQLNGHKFRDGKKIRFSQNGKEFSSEQLRAQLLEILRTVSNDDDSDD